MRKSLLLMLLFLSIPASLSLTTDCYAKKVTLSAQFLSWNPKSFGDLAWVRISHEKENPSLSYIFYNVSPQKGKVLIDKSLYVRNGDTAVYRINSKLFLTTNPLYRCEGQISERGGSKVTMVFTRNDTPPSNPGPWFSCKLVQS